ncbi:putative ABC transporter permease [Listeria grandensis FSL F6-0971]|uniref:Putative ABC transporter permease n=1 Tax=Listeria grandensis FSL F6-0971 TaxID=1265819 RepID=W7AZ37_9LIST|nr:ABC transporter permease [Listeria grandensis]EUJ18500.1 putative ABC transporter permease [Listeria grandensis FSL F6-0971]
MKSMWDSVKMQLFYQWKAKYVITLLLFLVVLCGFSSYAQYSSLQQKEYRFNNTMEMYEKDGITLKQALSEDLEIKKDGHSEEISNVLKYDYYRVIAAKVALNPLNAPNQIFTSVAIVFLPIIFGIYSCHVAFFDFKHGTIKNQLLLKGYTSLFFSKLLSIVLVAIATVSATVLISVGIQFVFNSVMQVQPNVSVHYLAKLPLQAVYQSVGLILFGWFFFLLTTAIRSTLVSIVTLFLYMLLIPNLGGFDLKNLMLLTVSKIYNTSAATMDVASGESTNLIVGYVVIFAVFAVLTFCVYKWDKKRLCPKL